MTISRTSTLSLQKRFVHTHPPVSSGWTLCLNFIPIGSAINFSSLTDWLLENLAFLGNSKTLKSLKSDVLTQNIKWRHYSSSSLANNVLVYLNWKVRHISSTNGKCSSGALSKIDFLAKIKEVLFPLNNLTHFYVRMYIWCFQWLSYLPIHYW